MNYEPRYFTCVFLVTKSFTLYYNFWSSDLDLELLMTFTKCCYFNLVASRRTLLSSDNSCLIFGSKVMKKKENICQKPLYQQKCQKWKVTTQKSWSNDNHPTGVVNQFTVPTFPVPATAVKINLHHEKLIADNKKLKMWYRKHPLKTWLLSFNLSKVWNKVKNSRKSQQFSENVLNNYSICKSQKVRNQRFHWRGVPYWHATPVANVPGKPLVSR